MKRKLFTILGLIVLSGIMVIGCSDSSEESFSDTSNASEDADSADGEFKGKYSFQYIKNAIFENCVFDTKDAFWHGENITVRDSIVKGEYLAWYSDGLTLVNCKIIGTQPLCYCKNLKLADCEMIDTDLAFEKSEVEATVTTSVISIKNPLSGWIYVPEVGELIMDDPDAKGQIQAYGMKKAI